MDSYFLIAGYVLRWKIARHELGRAARWHFDSTNPVQPTVSSIRRLHAEPSLGLIVDSDSERAWRVLVARQCAGCPNSHDGGPGHCIRQGVP